MKKGFTLIELMVVVAIILFLAMLTVPKFMKQAAKSKRSEAYVNLGSLYAAEKAYFIENGKYTDKLMGEESLSWEPDGKTVYSYGFGGSEGVNNFSGKSGDSSKLSQHSSVSDSGFVIAAVGDIDGDGEYDVITVDQDHEFKIAEDDLS